MVGILGELSIAHYFVLNIYGYIGWALCVKMFLYSYRVAGTKHDDIVCYVLKV